MDASAGLGGEGTSWARAYKYLQDALFDPGIAYGDEIWVATGTYYPDEDEEGSVTLNDRAESFRLPDGVALYGGFDSGGGTWQERDLSAHEAILSGDLAGNDGEVDDPVDLLSDPDRSENSFHVVIVVDTDANAMLDGFIVTGGNANGSAPDDDGGGIYGYPLGNATITNCTIQGNSASRYGGGLYGYMGVITGCVISGNAAYGGGAFYFCDGSINNCTISDNRAALGGGLYHCNSSITACTISGNRADYGGGLIWCGGAIRDCTVIGNAAEFSGGGLRNCDGPITACTVSGNTAELGGGLYLCNGPMTSCRISGNRADYGGGLYRCDGPLENCILSGNQAEFQGGGIYTGYKFTLAVTYCTFGGNSALNGNGIACDSNSQSYPSTVELQNCILWDGGDEIHNNDGSTITILYSDVWGGWEGLGNIDQDPLFVREGYWDENGTPGDESDDSWVAGDYRLQSEGWRWDSKRQRWRYDEDTSRCIDAGNPGTPLGEELLRVPEDGGNLWGINKRVNMGAYGGTAEASMGPHDWALLADLTNDGIADWEDFCRQAGDWLESAEDQPGDLNRDGIIDCLDLELLTGDWLGETSWYE